MKSIDSQTALIKGWLLNGRSITQLDAFNMFGCFRLAARIANIREEGLDIVTDMITVNDKRIAQYYLSK
jgi:hypothetical protein